jgi:hypothetical protein
LAERNVLQPNITSRLSSFITVSEKRAKEKGNLLWVEKPWLEFNPSPPSIISILDENINFIPTLKS